MRWLRLLVIASLLARVPSVHADPVMSNDASPTVVSPATLAEQPTRTSLVTSAAEVGLAYGLLYTWVTLAWYVRTTDSDHFSTIDEGWFGRDTYAGGADKLGHAWGNYAMTRGVSQVLQHGGWPRTGSILTAGGLSLAFFTFSEIKDGYKEEFGFSYGDMLFNSLGVGLGMLMESVPAIDRRFDFRISYWPSSAYIDRLQTDGPFNTPEDYSGQTMLLAYHLRSIEWLRHNAAWTQFFDLDVGYQTQNYKPASPDGDARTQELFVGASVDLQAVFDAVMQRRTGAGFVHFLTEMYQPPYTTLRIGEVQRVSPPLMTTP